MDPLSSWTLESSSLVLDELFAQATGAGGLVFRFNAAALINPLSAVVGFVVQVNGKELLTPVQEDTFTDTAGTRLNLHSGELNCNWVKPAGNAYLKINSIGRLYYTFSNESGQTSSWGSHFTSSYVPEVNNYTVHASINNTTVIGDKAEIYARASSSSSYYFLQYSQQDWTWRLGKRVSGLETILGTWTQGGPLGLEQTETFDLAVNSNVIKAFVGGVERISVADSTYSSGYAGLGIIPGIVGNGGTRPERTAQVMVIDPELEGEGQTEIPEDPLFGLQFDNFEVIPNPLSSITISLSKDGETPVGTPKTLLLTPTNTQYLVGGESDKWGAEWSIEDVRAGVFSVIIQRSYGLNAPSVDFCQAIIYYTGTGGLFEMSYRETARRRQQYGWETAFGTAVAGGKRFRSLSWDPAPNLQMKEHRSDGEKLISDNIVITESTTIALAGVPCYNELVIPFSMMLGAPTSHGTANQRQNHFLRFDNRGEQRGRSLTLELGEEAATLEVFGTPTAYNRAERVKGVCLADFNIDFSRTDATVGGNGFGHKIEDNQAMSAGVNDVQTITITATGGSFKARFNGSAWATINIPVANAAALDTALEAITTLGAGSLTVTGSGPYVVTFTGVAFAGKPQPLIELDSSSATGGTVTIAHTTNGGVTEYPKVLIEPGHLNVYLADSFASLSSNRMSRCSMVNFGLTGRVNPFYHFRRSDTNFQDRAEGSNISARFALKAHKDSEVLSLLGTARSNARKFLRIEAIGPLAYGADNHEFVLDAAVKVAAVGKYEDEDGLQMANYELALIEDPAWGNSMTVWIRNLLAGATYS